jgi:putative DNA primase/helicase
MDLTLGNVILDAEEFLKLKIQARKRFLAPWLTEGSITLLSGWRGSGKTWLAVSILDTVTKGGSLGPWKVENPVPCLYLDAEMPIDDTQQRLQSFNNSGPRLAPLYVYSEHLASERGVRRAHITSDYWRTALEEYLTEMGIKLWILDNISSCTPGLDESAKKDWDEVNQWLLKLRFKGIATIPLHHTGKKGDQRGTSGREDHITNSIIISPLPVQNTLEVCRFKMRFTKKRVSYMEADLVADTTMTLKDTNGDGCLCWQFSEPTSQKKQQIYQMLDESCEQKEICKILGVSKGYVSRIKTEGITDGYLSKNGRLTERGRTYCELH